jgi:hypothetical protein
LIIAMPGDAEPPPETNAPKFTIARFQYGILVLLIVGTLGYGGALLLSRLFKSDAPTTDAPVTGDLSVAEPVPPQPRCRYGFGVCDWAGLRSPRPRCHNGVGTCDWARLGSPPPHCHDGDAACDSAELEPPQPRCHYGVGTCAWGRRWPN